MRRVSWNPTTGCSPVSKGCDHCSSARIAHMLWGKQYQLVDDPESGPRVRAFADVMTHEDRALIPIRFRKPTFVDVSPMGDLFHDSVPDSFLDRVFATMLCSQKCLFLITTKRPERMLDYCGDDQTLIRLIDYARLNIIDRKVVDEKIISAVDVGGAAGWKLPNVTLSVSVEDQETYDRRVLLLKDVVAAKKAIVVEPILGPVDVGMLCMICGGAGCDRCYHVGKIVPADYVFVGAERGHNVRRAKLEWFRQIGQACKKMRTPVCVKGLGPSIEDDGGAVIGFADFNGTDPAEWPPDVAEMTDDFVVDGETVERAS